MLEPWLGLQVEKMLSHSMPHGFMEESCCPICLQIGNKSTQLIKIYQRKVFLPKTLKISVKTQVIVWCTAFSQWQFLRNQFVSYVFMFVRIQIHMYLNYLKKIPNIKNWFWSKILNYLPINGIINFSLKHLTPTTNANHIMHGSCRLIGRWMLKLECNIGRFLLCFIHVVVKCNLGYLHQGIEM